MRTILIIDVSHICYRALYTSSDLTFRGIKTGVIYGSLRDIMELRLRFNADHVVFCFDSRESKRKELFPEYKSNRRKIIPGESPTAEITEEDQAWLEMHRQMLDLRLKYLSWAGFSNILIKNGYEADDIAASVVMHNVTPEDTVYLITGDKDFYQLIRPNVTLVDPTRKKQTTYQSFWKEWSFEPHRWWEFQSICGCIIDTVPGIKGVGPVGAAKYVRGEINSLPAHMHLAIDSRKGKEIRARNAKLVRLPFDNEIKFNIKPDRFDLKGWRKVCEELGAKSLKLYTQ